MTDDQPEDDDPSVIRMGRLGPIRHGANTYKRGECRCDVCRAAHRDWTRANRQARLTSGALNHGKRSSYDAGCRCFACRQARYNTARSTPPKETPP